MKIVYKTPETVMLVHRAIEQAEIDGREIDYIDLSRDEWNEFRDYMLRFTPARLVTDDCLFHGVRIKGGNG